MRVKERAKIMIPKSNEDYKKISDLKILPGFYEHWKTKEIYEVLMVTKDCTNCPDCGNCGVNVVYRNVKTRQLFTRDAAEFKEILDYVPRFKLITELGTPLQLFVTTLRMNRLEYLRMCQENPLFVKNRANQPFKYMLGDKISFANAIRLVNTKTANILLSWLNAWSDVPTTSNEKHCFIKQDGE